MKLKEAIKKTLLENRNPVLMWLLTFTILTTFLTFKQAYDFRSYTAFGGEVVVPVLAGVLFFRLSRKWRKEDDL